MTREETARILLCNAAALPEGDVLAVTEDSRSVLEGAIFFALRGDRVDGHDFANDAAKKGAVLIVGDREGLHELGGLPYIYLRRARHALALFAHALAGKPSEAMTVVGVTGTNGKSSTVTLIHHILEGHGIATAMFGTLGYRMGDTTLAAPHTTPFPVELAALFRSARDSSHSHAIMEVSSHALEQDRVAGVSFDVGVFTNLSQDHLDYHDDMDSYRAAKVQLFELIEDTGKFTVVNCEDDHAQQFIRASKVPCYTFGNGGQCSARDVEYAREGTRFTIDSPWGSSPVTLHLLGRHNVYNALAAMTVCCGLGLPLDSVAASVAQLDTVPGRFEGVNMGQDFQVVVDYAHTDDGLRNVLEAARGLCTGRIIALFGCGGDRDRSKRPKMAAVVARLADHAVVTSDNPRTEEAERIILDIEVGMQQSGKRRGEDYTVLPDRREAIRYAIGLADAGDFVLIAGKGHEDYQILGSKRIHFDDREEARAALAVRLGAHVE